MRFKCPKCSKITNTDDINLGKIVPCDHCKEEINVPAGHFETGAVINDFIIQNVAGVGGMGVVYLAHQITLDRRVALKILKEKFTDDSEFVNQFIKEARSAAKLNHPNIVQAYAVGEENGVFFFAMEYVDGETMKAVLARENKIASDRAAKIVAEIANALDYAWNESKIVHHDIKPDNIMLTKQGKAKLADLGLASKFGDTENDDGDEVLGTPQYISPEQLLGEPTDVRSDIYSLGATLYHLVTGTFPYNGENTTEVAHQHVNGTLEAPVSRDPSVPKKLSDIIVKMMSKDINERYQTASAVAHDLYDFIKNPADPAAAPVSVAGVITPGEDGVKKLSIGGGMPMPPKVAAPPPAKKSPDAAEEKTSSASSASKVSLKSVKPSLAGKSSAVSTPKVNLNKTVSKGSASVAVPKLNAVSAAKTSSASAPAVPILNKKAETASEKAPAVAAPVSKPEPVAASAGKPVPATVPVAAPAANPATAAPAEQPPAEEKTPKLKAKKVEKPKEVKKENAPEADQGTADSDKSSGKNKKTKTAKKEKQSKGASSAKSKPLPGWVKALISSGVVLVIAAGGIGYYLYKNQWKAPILDDIAAWNKARKEAAQNVVHRVPPKRERKLTLQEKRKDYIPGIQAVIKFLTDNPSQGKEFIKKVDDFIFDNGRPVLENEKAPFAEMIALRAETDEKVWVEPARAQAAAAHQREINHRIQMEAAQKAEESRIEAVRKAEEARIEAVKKAEEIRRLKDEEDKRKVEAALREYQQRIQPVYYKIAGMFYAGISDDGKAEEFIRAVDNLFVDYQPDGIQMPIYQKLDAFAKILKAEFPRFRAAYKFMTENKKVFCGHIFVLPRYGQVEIMDIDFAKHQVTVKSTMTEKVRKISLDNDELRSKFFELFIKKLAKEKDIKYLPFYYEFFFGDRNKAASMIPAGSNIRSFFQQMR